MRADSYDTIELVKKVVYERDVLFNNVKEVSRDNRELRESVRQLRALVVALEEDLRKARGQAAACRRIHRDNV